MLGVLRRTVTGPRLRVARHKAATLRSRIMPMPLPERLVLTLPATLDAEVKPGQQVARNQLLARENSTYGRRLHAPTSGQVLSITTIPAPDQNQAPGQQLILQVDHEDKGNDLPPIDKPQDRHADEILERIATAGVVCTDPAQSGAAQRLATGRARQAQLIIINAAESEPYLCADEALIREHAQLVVQGSALLQQAGLAQRCVIAFQHGKPAALTALREALANSSVELALLPADDYPPGTDPQVIRFIANQDVSSGCLPEDQGILLFSASDAAAVCQAVTAGLPHTSRVVALAGQALRTPKCFVARFGTPIAHLLSLAGCRTEQHTGTLLGGPLCGQQLDNIALPVTVNTTCVIALGENEAPATPDADDCIRCGDCIDVCPVHLQPQLLLELNAQQQDLPLLAHGMADCIHCGACTHVCPSAIDLATQFQHAQQRLIERADQQQLSQHWQRRFQFHQYRLKRDRQQAQDHFAAPTATGSDNGSSRDTRFSRDQARNEIADAVARVRAKRNQTQQNKDESS